MTKLKRKEQNINNEFFKEYFDYQSPSNMYTKVSETEGVVNEVRVNLIIEVLARVKKVIEIDPKDDVLKIEENEKIIDVVERILEINNKIKSEQSLKNLTPNQMLSRLPIS